MKSWLFIIVILLAGCVQQTSSEKKLRVAATHVDQASYNATQRKDSMILEEQNQYGEWMIKTFYALKQNGYSDKKAWTFIDSSTRSNFRDSIPHWYTPLKLQTESSIRDRKLYKRL